MNASSTVLSLSVPGLPLDPAEFANPWTPLNPGGNPATAENFAWLVDAIPEVSSTFVANGNSIETLYGQLVQANTPVTVPPAPAPVPALPPVRPIPVRILPRLSGPVVAAGGRQGVLQRLFTAATVPTPEGRSIKTLVETPALRRYLDLRAARDEAVTRYMSQLLQVDMDDPAEKQRWEAKAAVLRTQLQATTQAVEAEGAGEIEDALSTVASNDDAGQNNSVATIFATARLNFELSTLGSVLGPGYTWHMTLAQPANWFTPEATFFDVDLRTSRTLPVNRSSRFQQLDRLTGLDSGLWSYRTQGKTLRRPVAQESLDIRVRFKFARVSIRRPWLDTSLFSLGGWAMAGRRRNDLSTGSLVGNTGIFPLLPGELIIARDLQISAAWSQSDVAFIRERLEQKDLAFGPFALSGKYALPRAAAATVTQASFDGVNITAPGLQAIGRMSQLVPACPPLDG
ncbi:hypothetical protein [Hyalangium versicolor]|uniref:hypothetical protein n=1 Tax=Hyalangium versicolor TaxID=2861190 RepID=UPI001CCC2209|nr:hypothetical protein [Hyalangium versicolor]